MARELRQIGDVLYWRYKLLEILIRNYKATHKIKWDAVWGHNEESCLIFCKVVAADWKGVMWTRRWRQNGGGHRLDESLLTDKTKQKLLGPSWMDGAGGCGLSLFICRTSWMRLIRLIQADWNPRRSGSWEDWPVMYTVSCGHYVLIMLNCSRMIKNTVHHLFSFFC